LKTRREELQIQWEVYVKLANWKKVMAIIEEIEEIDNEEV
jgi:hypothetical protein